MFQFFSSIFEFATTELRWGVLVIVVVYLLLARREKCRTKLMLTYESTNE